MVSSGMAVAPIESAKNLALTPSPPRLGALQSLRFWAALMVLLYHSGVYYQMHVSGDSLLVQALAYHAWGLMAVSIFFVLSGFVISQAAQQGNARSFIAARALRIYPSFWAACAVIIALKLAVFGTFSWRLVNFKSLSLLPWGKIAYVLNIEWSLVYEVAFYGLFTLALGLGLKRFLWLLAACWIVLSFALNAHQDSWTDLLPRGPEILLSALIIPFAAGAIAYRIHTYKPLEDWRWLLGVPPMYALYLISHSTLLTCSSLAIGGALLILVLAGRRPAPDNSRRPWTQWLGDCSYGVYLIHAALIEVICVRWFKSGVPNHTIGVLSLAALSFSVAVGFGAAEFAFYQRIRRGLSRATGKKRPPPNN